MYVELEFKPEADDAVQITLLIGNDFCHFSYNNKTSSYIINCLLHADLDVDDGSGHSDTREPSRL